MIKKTINNESGLISIKTSFILLLIGMAIHAGMEFVPPYSDYYFLKQKINSEAKLAHMYTNRALVRHILKDTITWGMDLQRENVVVDRRRNVIYISVEYPYTFVLFDGRYVKDHVFFYEKEKIIKEGGYLRND